MIFCLKYYTNGFDPNTLKNDIALLKLYQPIDFKQYPYLQPACLPVQGLSTNGSRCMAVGWGATNPTDKTAPSPSILQETPLPTMNPTICSSKWSGFNPSLQLCAGYTQGGISTCFGDSGGPLVCPFSNGVWVIEGIVSFGPDPCAKPDQPAVFTRVYGYLSWIKSITGL